MYCTVQTVLAVLPRLLLSWLSTDRAVLVAAVRGMETRNRLAMPVENLGAKKRWSERAKGLDRDDGAAVID